MKRMLEMKAIVTVVNGQKVLSDVRVRVDLDHIGKVYGPAAAAARGNRREFLDGAVTVEAFNTRPAPEEIPKGVES